jgi:hypothetical protein
VPEDRGRSRLGSALAVGIVTFLAGSFLLPTSVSLIVFVFSRSAYVQMMGRSPANPNWTPGLGYWCFCIACVATALVAAVGLARQTYRASLLKAERTRSEPAPERRPMQFTLKSLLLLQLYVAVGLGLIAWLGLRVVPCVLGVFGSMIGYGATVLLARHRVFHTFIGYAVGVVVGVVIAEATIPIGSIGLRTIEGQSLADEVHRWAIVGLVAALPVALLVAGWRLRRHVNRGNGGGTTERKWPR